MTLTDALLTALIAGAVSLIASLATYVAAMRTFLHQKHMQEREFERRFTEKLYDMRLTAYPKAFTITDQLRGEHVFGNALSQDLLRKVRDDLLEGTSKNDPFGMMLGV